MQEIFVNLTCINQTIAFSDPINRFNPTTCLCLSQARTWISNVKWCGLFLCSVNDVGLEVMVSFVDIGRIVDNHCLNLFCHNKSQYQGNLVQTGFIVVEFSKLQNTIMGLPLYLIVEKMVVITTNQSPLHYCTPMFLV